MKVKSLKVYAIVGTSISLALGGALLANKTVSSPLFHAGALDTHSMLLNSSTLTDLTSEYGSGTFTTNTDRGNEVSWSYNYGKASDGNLIELGKNEIGFPAATQFSIGNASPITSITSISVVIGETDALFAFGSHDNSTFYKLGYLTKATALNFTGANEYHYVRFANAKEDKTSVTISSISVNYDCVAADYSDELSDISSKAILADGSSVLSHDTTEYINGLNSNQSLKIAHTGSDYADFCLDLGKSIPSSEIARYSLEFYCNTLHNEDYDAKHNYMRFLVYPGVGSGRNSGKKHIQTENIKNGNDWTRVIVDFSGLSDIAPDETINSIYFHKPLAWDAEGKITFSATDFNLGNNVTKDANTFTFSKKNASISLDFDSNNDLATTDIQSVEVNITGTNSDRIKQGFNDTNTKDLSTAQRNKVSFGKFLLFNESNSKHPNITLNTVTFTKKKYVFDVTTDRLYFEDFESLTKASLHSEAEAPAVNQRPTTDQQGKYFLYNRPKEILLLVRF